LSTFDASTLRGRLTPDRLGSYLRATAGDLDLAIMLYDWNISASGAFFEDIGRVEVVLRNALDQALSALGDRRGWPTPWYQRTALFPGAHGGRALDDIATARRRATRGGVPESHGKVMAELSFGFWRYLCTKPYLTSLWVPALANAFPNHAAAGDPRGVRRDVDDRVQRVWFLRNRIAHHEPIHERNLALDNTNLREKLCQWMCADTHAWVASKSRWPTVQGKRP